MIEKKKVKYVGPTGLNPELGYMVTNSEIDISAILYVKYKDKKYIEDLPSGSKLKRSIKKED